MNTPTQLRYTKFYTTILCLLLYTVCARAAVVIYKITSKETIYGNGQSQKYSGRGWLVLDADTLAGYQVSGGVVNDQKLFSVIQRQKYIGGVVFGSSGAAYTYLAKAELPGTQFAYTLMESDFISGKNSSVFVDPFPRQLPKIMKGAESGVILIPATGGQVITSGTTTYILDLKSSAASNDNLRSVTDIVDAYATIMNSQGYTRVFPPPAQ